MAITANTYEIVNLPHEGQEFFKSLTSEDASGTEEILAAVANKTHYLTELHIRGDAAMDINVGSGETTGAVTTVHLGVIALAASSGFFKWKAPPGKGLKCTSGTSIAISASAGTIWIEARGKTCVNKL